MSGKVLLLGGSPGSGKTTISRRLAESDVLTGSTKILSIDEIASRLPQEEKYPFFRREYDDLLPKFENIVLDATFREPIDRLYFEKLAQDRQKIFLSIFFILPSDLLIQRALKRSLEDPNHPVTTATCSFTINKWIDLFNGQDNSDIYREPNLVFSEHKSLEEYLDKISSVLYELASVC